MSLQFRKRFKENLKSIPVYIEDNSTEIGRAHV